MTIREMIRAIQVEVRDSELLPERAAELLVKLGSLVGNCLEEIREADQEYALVLLKYLESEDKANRAKIRAETSPEYQRKREARDTKELAVTLIGNLKYYLRSKEEEMRLTR